MLGSPNRRRWGRLAAVGLSLALTFGFLELAVRLAGLDLNSSPRYRYHPTLGWTSDPSGPIEGVREDGFRHAVRGATPQGRRRLVVLGDSFTFGGAYPYMWTYPGLLDTWLRDAGAGDDAPDQWDVLSLAVPGWGGTQELMALRRFGLEVQPNAVVLQVFPFNDLCNDNLGLAFTCGTLDYHRPYLELDGDRLRTTYLHPVRARLRRWSRLFGWLELRLDPSLPAGGGEEAGERGAGSVWDLHLRQRARAAGLEYPTPPYAHLGPAEQPPVIAAGWRVSEKILAEIASVLAGRQVPLIAVVIPYAGTFEPAWLEQLDRRFAAPQPDYATTRVESLLAAAGAAVVSMRGRILAGGRPARDYFYPVGRDDRHLSDFGHRQVAIWVLEELRALRFTERTPPPSPTHAGPPSLQSVSGDS